MSGFGAGVRSGRGAATGLVPDAVAEVRNCPSACEADATGSGDRSSGSRAAAVKAGSVRSAVLPALASTLESGGCSPRPSALAAGTRSSASSSASAGSLVCVAPNRRGSSWDREDGGVRSEPMSAAATASRLIATGRMGDPVELGWAFLSGEELALLGRSAPGTTTPALSDAIAEPVGWAGQPAFRAGRALIPVRCSRASLRRGAASRIAGRRSGSAAPLSAAFEDAVCPSSGGAARDGGARPGNAASPRLGCSAGIGGRSSPGHPTATAASA